MGESKVVLTEDEFKKLDAMLRGVSARYAGWGGIDFDDIYQECWLKAVEVVNGTGEVNLDLICQCCYNRIFDLGRYQARRVNQIPIDPEQFECEDVYDTVDKSYSSSISQVDWNAGSRTKDFNSDLIVEEIKNLFPDGSNEREYVEELIVYHHLQEVRQEVFNRLFDLNSSMENEIAWNLGYAGSSSNGYRGVKRRVRAKVAEYLGIGENYNHSC